MKFIKRILAWMGLARREEKDRVEPTVERKLKTRSGNRSQSQSSIIRRNRENTLSAQRSEEINQLYALHQIAALNETRPSNSYSNTVDDDTKTRSSSTGSSVVASSSSHYDGGSSSSYDSGSSSSYSSSDSSSSFSSF